MNVSTVHYCPPNFLFADTALFPYPRQQTFYPPSVPPLTPSFVFPPFSIYSSSSAPPDFASFPDSLKTLQWNTGSLRASSVELIHFVSLFTVNPICIEESNVQYFSSFRIPEYSTLQSWSSFLSFDDLHDSGGVVDFVRKGLYFADLLFRWR